MLSNLVHLVVTCLLLLVGPGAAGEQDLEALREAALAKLPKPVEQLRVKELQQLLSERGAQLEPVLGAGCAVTTQRVRMCVVHLSVMSVTSLKAG